MSQNKKKEPPIATIRRLPTYLRVLYKMQELGRKTVSSALIAQQVGGTASQVRQDFRFFGPLSSSRNGYDIDSLIKICEKVLGIKSYCNPCIVVGYGNLGRAIANLSPVESRGFCIVAVFDNNPSIIGKTIANFKVHSMSELGKIVQEKNVKLAILTVPASAAQEVCNNLVAVGIDGILNFAPVQLSVPNYVVVEDVHIVNNLLVLNYLANQNRNRRKGKK